MNWMDGMAYFIYCNYCEDIFLMLEATPNWIVWSERRRGVGAIYSQRCWRHLCGTGHFLAYNVRIWCKNGIIFDPIRFHVPTLALFSSHVAASDPVVADLSPSPRHKSVHQQGTYTLSCLHINLPRPLSLNSP